jgi:transcriptional regulator with XRE-family HTH domain
MTENDLRKILSANIKHYRNRRDWSQIKFAAILDISANFLADIETEKSWISSLTLVKIANALNVEVFELFTPTAHDTDTTAAATTAGETLERFAQDLEIAVKHSVQKAIGDSVKHVAKQYTGTSAP